MIFTNCTLILRLTQILRLFILTAPYAPNTSYAFEGSFALTFHRFIKSVRILCFLIFVFKLLVLFDLSLIQLIKFFLLFLSFSFLEKCLSFAVTDKPCTKDYHDLGTNYKYQYLFLLRGAVWVLLDWNIFFFFIIFCFIF